MKVEVSRSDRAGKKWKAELESGKTVHFGATGYKDFTQHGDVKRRESYLARHRPNENWSKDGINTAGFWSRHLLWEKPTVQASARSLSSKGLQVSVK